MIALTCVELRGTDHTQFTFRAVARAMLVAVVLVLALVALHFMMVDASILVKLILAPLMKFALKATSVLGLVAKIVACGSYEIFIFQMYRTE